jgi:APA family basic amino acid/polyamine antiporter
MREMGFWMAVALVMGNMIGSGVFLLPASLAPFGGASLVGWLMSAAGSVLLALVFARLSRAEPAAGGPYAYTRQAFGDVPAFMVAWGYWISVWGAEAALAVACVGYLDPFFPSVVRSPGSAALTAIGLVWLLTAVNIRGVRTAAQVQVVTTALKLLPLAVIGIGGLFFLNPSHFAFTNSPNGFARDVTATATLTLWAFLGLECATIPAGRIKDPDRTIPRATVVGTILTAIVYIVSTVGVTGVLEPAALAKSTAPFADAARHLAGNGAAAIVALGAAVSCLGALNGWTLIVGQLPLAVANDGLFPPVFGRLSSAGTPATGMIISGLLATGLIALNSSRSLVQLFTFIILLSTLSTLIPYTFCSLAVFLLPRARTDVRRSATSTIVPMLAFVYSIWAITGAGPDVVFSGFLLLLCGLPVYVWVARTARGRTPSPSGAVS